MISATKIERGVRAAPSIEEAHHAGEEGQSSPSTLKRSQVLRGGGHCATLVILVDSSVWVDDSCGEKTPQVVTLIELFGFRGRGCYRRFDSHGSAAGCRDDLHACKLERALSRLPCFVLGGTERCDRAVANYRSLRTAGITPRKSIDVLIATFCIEEDIVLVHDDREFDLMVEQLGLRVIR